MAYYNGKQIIGFKAYVTNIEGEGGYDGGYTDGFAAGKSEGLSEGYNNGYSEGFEAGQESGGGGDYEQGFEDGKNSVVPFERYARQIMLKSLNIFDKSEVVLNLDSAENLVGLCTIQGQNNPNGNTAVEHLTINCPNLIGAISQMLHCDNFNVDNKLKRVTLNCDIQKATTCSNAFNNLRALEIIDGTPLDLSSSTSNSMFGSCGALVYVRFVPNSIQKNISFNSCNNLSNDTKQSIFDGLAPVETAQTLTLRSTLKILQSQVDSVNAKGWTVAGGTVVSEEEYYAE